ncbi:MAG: D-inositol 3-phosphate glycosyltransferase [Firmicutes bacterium ADurb.Bin456]|nr:MAG: D-inositol 3-phosphate glycosyltransferase [Firmicutes bacterium ADurb.Bin456]
MFTSVTETQGIVIAEAKAAGLPVVAVDANGVSEMVKDGLEGYLTDPVPFQFAEKVCRILEDGKLRKDMGIMARRGAEELSSANCTSQLLSCYSAFAGDKGRVANNLS